MTDRAPLSVQIPRRVGHTGLPRRWSTRIARRPLNSAWSGATRKNTTRFVIGWPGAMRSGRETYPRRWRKWRTSSRKADPCFQSPWSPYKMSRRARSPPPPLPALVHHLAFIAYSRTPISGTALGGRETYWRDVSCAFWLVLRANFDNIERDYRVSGSFALDFPLLVNTDIIL
jgi:hypothetical protein